MVVIKFVFFEKATKFDEISILLLTNKFVLYVSHYNFEYQYGSQSWNFIHRDQPNPNKVGLLQPNLVKIFLVLEDLPKVGLLQPNLVKNFLVLLDLPKLGLLEPNLVKIFQVL
jgi:hypothetical protein